MGWAYDYLKSRTTPIEDNVRSFYARKGTINNAKITKRINKCKAGKHKLELFFCCANCKFCDTPM